MLHKEITDKILNTFYKVYNALGWGFLEKVYRNAMVFELGKRDVSCEAERHIEVYYESEIMGEYKADIIVEKCVILELKTTEHLNDQHKYQLMNYLKASNIQVGLLLNFGKTPEFKRVIFTNTHPHPSNPIPQTT